MYRLTPIIPSPRWSAEVATQYDSMSVESQHMVKLLNNYMLHDHPFPDLHFLLSRFQSSLTAHGFGFSYTFTDKAPRVVTPVDDPPPLDDVPPAVTASSSLPDGSPVSINLSESGLSAASVRPLSNQARGSRKVIRPEISPDCCTCEQNCGADCPKVVSESLCSVQDCARGEFCGNRLESQAKGLERRSVVGKGEGLFSTETIVAGTTIGVYTGNTVESASGVYTMGLENGLKIDAAACVDPDSSEFVSEHVAFINGCCT